MRFFKTTINELTPRKARQLSKFVRAWRGKVYSVLDAQLIYVGDCEYLYKHSSGDYFLVWEHLYEDFGYTIYLRDEAINKIFLTEMLQSRITNIHKQRQILPILEAEFGIVLEL